MMAYNITRINQELISDFIRDGHGPEVMYMVLEIYLDLDLLLDLGPGPGFVSVPGLGSRLGPGPGH